MRRPPWALLAGAAGLAVVGGVAGATCPAPSPLAAVQVRAGGGSARTVRASLVCPDLRTVPGTVSTAVAVGAGSPAAGSVTLAPAAGGTGGAGGPAGPVLGDQQHVATYTGPLTGPLLLQAQGPLTGSLVAEQLSRGTKGTDRGWAEARCEPPRAEQWFVGAGTRPGDDPELVLANPADNPAVTDVTVLTPGGISETSAGHNIALAPKSVTRLRLATLAPDVDVTAVRVTTSTGHVAAAVRDARSNGETLLGTDWVPVSTPAARLTIPGVPGTVTGQQPTRVLMLANPAASDATVKVEVTGPRGTFVPTGLDAVPVSAGSVRAMDIGGQLGASSAALTITSDDPAVHLVAGVLVDAAGSAGTRGHEIAFLGPAQPLAGPALVPLIRTDGGADSRLVLSAPAAAVSLTVVVDPAQGPESQHRLTIAAGTTFAQSLRDWGVPDGSTVTVLPDPGSAPLFGARLIVEDASAGPLLSAFTLLGAPPQQRVAQVAELPAGN